MSMQQYSVGSFVLKVLGKFYFIVKRFSLSLSINKINSCVLDILLALDVKTLQKLQIKYPAISKLSDLYSAIDKASQKGKLLDCQLCEYTLIESKDKKSYKIQLLVWFLGKLCSAAPTISTAGGILSVARITCTGNACLLMFSVHSDYLYTPQNLALSHETLLKYNAQKLSAQPGTSIWSSGKLSDKDLITNSKQTVDDDIATLISKALNHLQKWRMQINEKALQTDNEILIDISKYIKSDYSLSSAVKKIASKDKAQNAYIKSLNSDLSTLFFNGTLWSSIIQAISGDKMLEAIPPSRGNQLIKIAPASLKKYKSLNTLNLSDILGISISIDALSHINTPDKIYLNCYCLCNYLNISPIRSRQVYGQYPLKTSGPKYRKVKYMDAPYWIYDIIFEYAGLDASKQKSGFKNKTELDMDSEQESAPKRLLLKILNNNSVKSLLDEYAKLTYFNTFCSDKIAVLNLAVSFKTLGIDQALGQTFKILFPNALSNNKKPATFYGKLTEVRYDYSLSDSPGKTSSLQLSCSMKAITDTSSTYAKFFENESTQMFYTLR